MTNETATVERVTLPVTQIGNVPSSLDTRLMSSCVFQVLSMFARRSAESTQKSDVQVGGVMNQTNPSGNWLPDAEFAIIEATPQLTEQPKTSAEAISLTPFFRGDEPIEMFVDSAREIARNHTEKKWSYSATFQVVGVRDFGVNPNTIALLRHRFGVTTQQRLPSECGYASFAFTSGHSVLVFFDKKFKSVLTMTSAPLSLDDRLVITVPRVLPPRLDEGATLETLSDFDPVIQLQLLHRGIEAAARTTR